MSNSFKIKIPQPCHESWDAMHPKGCGRFCNSCEQTVVDFTQWSDEEFVSFFQSNKTIPCGRFTQRQLALSIPSNTQPFFRFGKMSKYIAAGILSILSMQDSAWSQPIVPTSQAQAAQKNEDKIQLAKNEEVKLVGTIVGEDSEPLLGATVSVKDRNIETITNAKGNFTLEINDVAENYFIVASYLGDSTEVELSRNVKSVMIMIESNITIGEITVYKVEPNLWQRITKPFRKKY